MERRWERALVTGASSGIGAAVARQLAAEGTELVLVARSRERLDALAAELVVPTEVLVADLSDREQVEVVAERIGRSAGPVDLVVNNAGYGHRAELADVPPEVWLDMVQVNVSAVVRCTHAALRRARDGGRVQGVLNVASVAGFAATAGLGVYSATKSFLVAFGQGVGVEARSRGVSVCTLCPGLTRTDFHRRAHMEDLRLPAVVWQEADEVARAGLDGVASGRALVVPGALNKVAVTGARVLPLRAVQVVAGAVRGR
jgi:short-subunit dehydrogenase